MFKKALILIVLSCTGCSFLDPAASGNVVGTQVDEMSVPEDGKLIVSHIYERRPSHKGKNSQTAYNRRSFSDWFFGTTSEPEQNNDYVK